MNDAYSYLEINFDSIIKYFLSWKFGLSLLMIVMGVLLYKKISRAVKKVEARGDNFNKLSILNELKFILFLLLAIFVLQINGVNVSGLASSIGIIGIVIGFALQDELKDWIMGISITRERFFSVGDTVKYNDIEGVVIRFNLKCTVIEEVEKGDTIYISNRNISEIVRLSDRCDIDIPASYDISAKKMREICKAVSRKAKEIKFVHSCEFMGTESFDESLIRYRLRIHCVEKEKNSVKRAVNGLIQDIYEENGIEVPFNQLDVHIKSNKANS